MTCSCEFSANGAITKACATHLAWGAVVKKRTASYIYAKVNNRFKNTHLIEMRDIVLKEIKLVC